MIYLINDLFDEVICNIAIYAHDANPFSKQTFCVIWYHLYMGVFNVF